ncbi:MAG: hypothetical protein ACOYM2_06470 [Rectinemataceae bacterium]
MKAPWIQLTAGFSPGMGSHHPLFPDRDPGLSDVFDRRLPHWGLEGLEKLKVGWRLDRKLKEGRLGVVLAGPIERFAAFDRPPRRAYARLGGRIAPIHGFRGLDLPIHCGRTEGIERRRAVAMDEVEAIGSVDLRSACDPVHLVCPKELLDVVDMDKWRNGDVADRLLPECTQKLFAG